jgi:hypothetical protein
VRLILDHTIVGQSLLTNFTLRKDRRYAGCRICGVLFQPDVLREPFEPTLLEALNAEVEIAEWRVRHNKTHTTTQHRQFRDTGLVFSPEAAQRLAPFGLVAIDDAVGEEVSQALLEAPRAPMDDVEGSTKRR